MASPISVNPKIMHGAPCFAGTRVTIQSLADHLKAGYTIDRYLAEYPTVKREQVLAVLDLLQEHALRTAHAA